MEYKSIRLKKGREKSVLNRHPWIFSGALDGKSTAEEGDIVRVTDWQGKNLAYGFYSAKSQISCRVFELYRESESVDFETPEYWFNKISKALALRKALLDPDLTTTYRLLHAEGDFFPGIIADVYGNVVVLQVLIKAVESRMHLIQEAFIKCGFENIYLKTKSSSRAIEGIESSAGWLCGASETTVQVKENGLLFNVDFETGQKTGFFIDQRDNREMLRRYSKDKTVLNAFSYSGGFSVYALAGGAKRVYSLDISAAATGLANDNVEINQLTLNNHKAITEDCFQYLSNMPSDYYDLIVLDPPAFAKSARAVANASRGYKQINMKAFKKIKPGGVVFTFSCSQNIDPNLFRKIVFGAAAEAHRNVRIIEQLHQPADHPVSIFHPEGEYLKGLVLYVE
ncbi:class I SAM-dependent rRNA methyltransferase [Cytophagaceae bacterium ABcell3]|nr:class I SAM-dependent rRNA methyltransferase [Cytophagaceae bacterium ABcell3]